MNTLNNNIDIPMQTSSSISPILTDLGAALVFGLGFYFFKSHFKKSDESEKETKDQLKPLKEKIEDTISKWESAICLQKINSIIKNEVNEASFDPFMVLDQLQKSSINPDISTINTLLDTCSKLGDFTNFNRLCELMIDSESGMISNLPSSNIVTFNIILKGINLEMCKLDLNERAEFCKGKVEIIMKEIEKRQLKPNDITLNTVIDIMVENGNFDLAWKYFDEMESNYGIEPDIYTYSTLLKSIKNYQPDEKNIERAFEILKIVKLSKTKGIRPDEILYNCIIDTCVKYNKMEQAKAVFSDMKDAGISPSKITYAIMIRGYGNSFELERAFDIFEEMKSSQVEPNEIIYGCLLNACVKSNKIESAVYLYEEIKNYKNITMNVVLYSTLIKGYTKEKNFEKAFEIYNKMLNDDSIVPNIITYNAILDCCVECNDIEMMKQIYEEIKDKAVNDDSSSQPDLITYSTVIKGYSRVLNSDKVLDLYYYLKGRSDLEMDEVIYNSVLDGLLKSGKYEDAIKIHEDMIANKIEKSNATYSILIKLYSKMNDVENAVEIYNVMISNKIKPTLITYTAILQILIKTKRIQNAIEIFQEILSNKMNPDQVLFNVIINGCVFNGRLEEACSFLKESFNSNIKLNKDVYKNVLTNLLTNRVMERNYKNELTLSICKEIRSKGMEIEYELYHKIIKMIYNNKSNQAENNIKRNKYSDKDNEKDKTYSRRNFKKNDKERYREQRKNNNKKYYNKYEENDKNDQKNKNSN
jgi:pentatricopeptide repeat protein